ncbi:DUF655 domain-containing protein [Alcaligenaceae bacterium]|nr:DUF655 domain-containing protein [Alcaligenaceae bacterium]
MNPFTESTVACPVGADLSNEHHSTKRRSFFRLTLGAVGLATGLGGLSAVSLPVTGALLARAGALAAIAGPGVAIAIDVNSATEEQLRGIRGIGPKTAQIIIEERARGGRYESFEDFSDRVKGIGPKKSAALQASGLTLGGQGASKPNLATLPRDQKK